MDQVAFAAEVKAQRIERELGKRQVARAAHLDADCGHGVGRANRGLEPIGRFPLRFGDFHRPEGDVIAGAEFARHAVDSPRAEHCAARNREPLLGRYLLVIHLKFRHRHGGYGPQIMRIEDAQQRFGDFRKLVVYFEMNARREEREGLQHTFHVRILALVGFEQKARGDLGILLRELRAHLAEKRQFPFVIEKQFVTHQILP